MVEREISNLVVGGSIPLYRSLRHVWNLEQRNKGNGMEIDPKVVGAFVAGLAKVVEWVVHHASGHGNHAADTLKELTEESARAAMERLQEEILRRNMSAAFDTLDDAMAKCAAEMKRLDALMPKPLPLTDDGRE